MPSCKRWQRRRYREGASGHGVKFCSTRCAAGRSQHLFLVLLVARMLQHRRLVYAGRTGASTCDTNTSFAFWRTFLWFRRLMCTWLQVQVVEEQAVQHADMSCLRRALHLWQQALAEAKALQLAAEHHDSRLKQQAVHAWAIYHEQRMRTFDMQCHARSFRFTKTASTVLRTWRAHCSHKQHMRRRQLHAQTVLQRSCKRHVLEAWAASAWVRPLPWQQVMWIRAVEALQDRKLHSVLVWWATWVRLIISNNLATELDVFCASLCVL